MIIDLTEFDKLKRFIFEEDVNETQFYITKYCPNCEPEENSKCEYQKMCLRYFPIFESSRNYNIIKDLFETIEFLTENKSKE